MSKRTLTVAIRMTEEEHAELIAEAARRQEKPSTLARRLVLGALREPR